MVPHLKHNKFRFSFNIHCSVNLLFSITYYIPCLNEISNAMINSVAKFYLGNKKMYFILESPVYHERKSGQELKEETWSQKPEQRP